MLNRHQAIALRESLSASQFAHQRASEKEHHEQTTRCQRHCPTSARLDELIEEATVDCYDEEEQATGFFTMIDENLASPFATHRNLNIVV
jgi:hypothetical protein